MVLGPAPVWPGHLPKVRIRTLAGRYASARLLLVGAGMDAVNFSIKRAHLALQRMGRTFIDQAGLTPARFDLMHALGALGAKQSDLWKRLEVVRSMVCEMIASLEKLGWVERAREGRTRVVRLTAAGREVLEGVLDRFVARGEVGACVDHALELVHEDPVVLAVRQELIAVCAAIRWAFRARAPFEGAALYVVVGSPE